MESPSRARVRFHGHKKADVELMKLVKEKGVLALPHHSRDRKPKWQEVCEPLMLRS